MKRIFKFLNQTEKYVLEDNNKKEIIIIEKGNLLLKGNEVYNGLFKEYMKNDEIVIEFDDKDDDKLYFAIYTELNKLILEIKTDIDALD